MTETDFDNNLTSFNIGIMSSETKQGADEIPSWKLNGVFNSKLKPLSTTFLNSINLPDYNIGIYIVYDLDASPRNPANDFQF